MRMKHLTVAALTLLLSVSCSQRQEDYPFRNPDLPIDERIDDLLKRLTAEEKIGQMMNTTPAIERLGIPEYDWWNEALHGVARAGKATVFPQAIAMAATFDDDALYETFTMVSDEARAKYHQYQKNKEYDRYKGLTFWTPNINIFRDPRWGRGMETYGEDPYLTERMGVAVVKGLQGDDPKYFKTHACAKHYAVHSGPEWNRHEFDVTVTPRDLWQTYLPAFEALVKKEMYRKSCAPTIAIKANPAVVATNCSSTSFGIVGDMKTSSFPTAVRSTTSGNGTNARLATKHIPMRKALLQMQS